jgi:hypothetical protein
MAIVIHTRKEKYQYAYEHTRVGDKVVSRYMHPVDADGNKRSIKVAQQPDKEVAQHTDKEVEDLDKKYMKRLEEEDIKSNAAERHKEAEKILKNSQNYYKEYGVEKNGRLIKEGFKDILSARDYAGEHHYKTSTYDRKAIHLQHFSEAGYEIVITKKELKEKYKKQINILLGKKIK